MAISAYSCLSCGDNVKFDIATKSFKCDSCGTQFTLEQMNKAFPEEDDKASWNQYTSQSKTPINSNYITKSQESETTVKIYNCPACGAELMTDSETLAASFCAFCGKPVSISDRLLSGKSLPSRAIPFDITHDRAFEVFQSKLKHKPLLPQAFTQGIQFEDFKSIYVPFKLYEAECAAAITAKCENISRWSDSEYNYTKVDTYEARRSGAMSFSQIPADASDKISDADMQAIEPFNMSTLQPFSKKYLSGHYAEAPTTKESELLNTIYGRLKPAAEKTILGTIWGYDRVSLSSSNVNLESAESEYVMLPVWMSKTNFKGRDYLFAINGQTGKFAGKLPVDGMSALFMFIKIALIVFIAVFIGLEVFLWIT